MPALAAHDRSPAVRPDAALLARLRGGVGVVVDGDEMTHVLRVAAQVARARAAAVELQRSAR